MNQSLSDIAGLPITLTDAGVVFGETMGTPDFQEKRLGQWRDFFIDPGLDNDTQLYYIYRNALLLEDQQRWESLSLRYDLTLLFAGRVGREPIHTAGHIHKSAPDSSVPFPEIYTVLSGSALFLLQDDAHRVLYSIPRSAGETIVVPGACGHVTVNALSSNPLLIANVFTATPDISDYSLFQSHHGAAWYPILSDHTLSLEHNPSYDPSYRHIPAIPALLPFGIDSSPLYRQVMEHPERFSAFSNPSSFAEQLTPQALLSPLQ